MPHASAILLFTQVFLLLLASVVGGTIARRLRQPPVVGELLGGIALGPTLLGALWPDLWGRCFPAAASDPALASGRDAVLRLGMLFFLFAAGREVHLTSLRTRAGAVAGASLLGILIPFAVGWGAVLLAPALFLPAGNGPTTSVFPLALFVGTALAISALPVIARILLDMGLLRHPFGATVLAAATLDDLIGWSLFAALLHTTRATAAAHGGSEPSPFVALALALGSMALVLGVLRPLLVRRRVPARISQPDTSLALRLGMPVLVVLLFAALAEVAGLHAVFGAFIAGVLFADESGTEKREDPIATLALGVFAPIYFASVGLKTNFLSHFDPALTAFVLLVACIGKVTGAGLGARLGGLTWREALAVGSAMNARGAMEILLATVALEAGLIDTRLFVALVFMAVVTSVIAGPAVRRLLSSAELSAGESESA